MYQNHPTFFFDCTSHKQTQSAILSRKKLLLSTSSDEFTIVILIETSSHMLASPVSQSVHLLFAVLQVFDHNLVLRYNLVPLV